MGRASREKPKRLASKLAQIRAALNLSQDGLIRRMGLEHRLMREDISKYERGVREPSLLTLLMYARIAGVSTDILIDDELDLAKQISSSKMRRPSN
jgi:transcriptional regulator with XRE-family HTH domain